MDLTKQTPIEIDTELYALYVETSRAEGKVMQAQERLLRQAGARQNYYTKTWSLSLDEARAKVEAEAQVDKTYRGTSARDALKSLDEAKAKYAASKAKSKELDAEFTRRGGWTRAFLVNNGNGHVHSSMNCSTCNRGFYATSFQWMVEYSAHDEAEIVEAAGWRACTICYPSAPVGTVKSLPTKMFSDEDKSKAEAKAERDAAKAARLAKKIEKALTADGSEFVVQVDGRYPERFKTEQAATQWAVSTIAYHKAYDYPYTEGQRNAVSVITEAIASKHGKTVEEVTAEIDKKVAAKIKRDSRG